MKPSIEQISANLIERFVFDCYRKRIMLSRRQAELAIRAAKLKQFQFEQLGIYGPIIGRPIISLLEWEYREVMKEMGQQI